MTDQIFEAQPKRTTVGVQAPFTLVSAGNTEVAVNRQGKGVPVICLHASRLQKRMPCLNLHGKPIPIQCSLGVDSRSRRLFASNHQIH